MKWLTLFLLCGGLLLGIAEQAISQTAPDPLVVKIGFKPDKVRYKRGATLKYVVTVANPGGQPVAGQEFRVILQYSQEGGGRGHQNLPRIVTNEKGVATGKVQIPTDPLKDDCHIQVLRLRESGDEANDLLASRRIPIG